jgi:hypothetical protein
VPWRFPSRDAAIAENERAMGSLVAARDALPPAAYRALIDDLAALTHDINEASDGTVRFVRVPADRGHGVASPTTRGAHDARARSSRRPRLRRLNHLERAMVVAVVAVRVMQPLIDEIVRVVAMRHRLVTATGTVDVPVNVTGRRSRVLGQVRAADRHPVLVNVVLVGVVQTAVQVVVVALVAHGDVAAAGAVLVIVAGMDLMLSSHGPEGTGDNAQASSTCD